MSSAAAELALPGGWFALFTSRAEGNLSSVGGVAAERGAANRERLRARIGAGAIARGYQVHGSAIALVSRSPERDLANDELEQADGQATALRGIAVMVLAADCLPVALGGEGAVAVVHAGWRGLAAGVLEHGARSVRALAGPGPLAAAVGPCAGACCYEVGPEVHAALGRPGGERGSIDLRAIAHERLLAAGVQEVRHEAACTICDERFFSHRREGGRAGRQAGVAWLR